MRKTLLRIAECAGFMLLGSIVCALVLVASGTAQAQTDSPPFVSTPQLSLKLADAPQPVPTGSVQRVGNPGHRTLYYWIVTEGTIGQSAAAGPFELDQAADVFNGSQGASISWAPGANATSYDVLRTLTSTPPSAACNCAVATAVTGTSATDNSDSLQAYTVAPVNASAYAIQITNKSTGRNASALQANGQPLTPGSASPPALYNVQAYGAKGDGSTDDVAAIQAADNACKAAGDAGHGYGTVFFPPGTYALKSYVTAADGLTTALQYRSCRWEGGAGFQRATLKWVGTTAIDTVVRVASASEAAENSSSGGIVAIKINANFNAARNVYFADFVDKMWTFDKSQLVNATLYGADLANGWVNAHFTDLRFDAQSGYVMRLACASGQFMSSFVLDRFTIGTAGTTAIPPGMFLFDFGNGICPQMGSAKFANARIELNPSQNFATTSGIFETKNTGTGGTGVTVTLDSIQIQNQGSNNPYLLKASYAGGDAVGTAFVFHDFRWQKLAGYVTGTNYNYGLNVPWTSSGYFGSAVVSSAGMFSYGGYQAQLYDKTKVAFSTRLRTDANDEYHILGNGKMEWCTGASTNTCDANLYRKAVAQLGTDGEFSANTLDVAGAMTAGSLSLAPTVYPSAPAYAASASLHNTSNTASGGVTLNSVGAGDFLIVTVSASFGTMTSITDSCGDTPKLLASRSGWGTSPSRSTSIYYVQNATAGNCTITTNWSPSAGTLTVTADRYTGVDTVTAIDSFVVHSDSITGATTLDSTALTTLTTNDTLWGFCSDTGTATLVAGTGFSARSNPTAGELSEDGAAATPGSYDATCTGGSGTVWFAAGVALRPKLHTPLGTGSLADWSDSGVANGSVPVWVAADGKWEPQAAPPATAAFAAITGQPTDNANLATALNAKAPLASPTFTGTPAAPTPATTDSSTKIATTAYVQAQHFSPVVISAGSAISPASTGAYTTMYSTSIPGGTLSATHPCLEATVGYNHSSGTTAYYVRWHYGASSLATGQITSTSTATSSSSVRICLANGSSTSSEDVDVLPPMVSNSVQTSAQRTTFSIDSTALQMLLVDFGGGSVTTSDAWTPFELYVKVP